MFGASDKCLIVKLTNDCNLRCSYCYHFRNQKGSAVHSRMSDEVLGRTIRALLDHNRRYAHYIWHGGEPLLLGLPFFEQIVQVQKAWNKRGLSVSNSVQTNGTLLTPEWVSFFREHDFHVGISLDGTMDLHMNHRQLREQSTFSRILEGIQALKAAGVRYGILAVVDKDSLGHEEEIFDFFYQAGIRDVGFLPAVVTREAGVDTTRTLAPEEYRQFLIHYFEVWTSKGIYGLSIREFDEFLRWKRNVRHKLCTNSEDCYLYLTVTPEGTIHLCDCFTSDGPTQVGTVFAPLREVGRSETMRRFTRQTRVRPAACRSCPYQSMCNGGCKYYRYLEDHEFTQPSYYCQAFRGLWERMDKELARM